MARDDETSWLTPRKMPMRVVERGGQVAASSARPPIQPAALHSAVPLGLGILRLVVKRALSRPTRVLFTLAGLVVGVSLLTAVPIYGDATIEKTLRAGLVGTDGRPPLALTVQYQESTSRPTSLSQIDRADAYLRQAASTVGLPVSSLVRYLAIDTHRLYDYALDPLPLIYTPGSVPYATIASLERLEEHVVVVEGDPLPRGLGDSPEVPVSVPESAAEELGLDVGDRFWYVGPSLDPPEKVAVKVTSIWRPRDSADADYWSTPLPDVTYRTTLFASEEDLVGRVLPAFRADPALKASTWYLVFEPGGLHAAHLERVRDGFVALGHDVSALLPDVRLDRNLEDDLAYWSRLSETLRILLLVMSAPLLAIALYYVFVSLSMVMERERGEIALLRSRGASAAQVVAIYLVESVVVGLAALALGLAGGLGVAQLFGKAFGFLQFAIRPPLPTLVSGQTVAYGLAVVGLAVVCTVVPAVRASRLSIVAFEREAGRSAALAALGGLVPDLVAVAAAGLGYWSLASGRDIVGLTASGDYLIDPLLILVPAIFVGALGLLFRRTAPPIVALLAIPIQRLSGAPSVLALRQIYRSPGTYQPLVLLLVLTLGLGIFSASAARTLETNYSDRGRYGAPADLELAPYWEYDPDSRAYLEPPLGAFDVAGVTGLTRVQPYAPKAGTGRAAVEVQLLAVDRGTFASVSWWRRDFAAAPLGALLNALSTSDEAILVSPSFLGQFHVTPGDLTRLSFQPSGLLEGKDVEFRVAGVADYFPTLFPERGPFVVANLDYLQDQIGLGIYYVWLSVDPRVKSATVVRAIEANGVRISRIRDQRVVVNVSRLDPQRTGTLGVLSVAFLGAALLTVLGFFLHTLLSLQRRTHEIGVLRTLGLSWGQLVAMLLFEQSIVTSLGVGAGIGVGLLASRIFVPFLQVDVDRLGKTPPFVIDPASGEVGLVGVVLLLMLGIGVGTTLWLVRRTRLHQAVQFGARV